MEHLAMHFSHFFDNRLRILISLDDLFVIYLTTLFQ
jgi:hypothetical protein